MCVVGCTSVNRNLDAINDACALKLGSFPAYALSCISFWIMSLSFVDQEGLVSEKDVPECKCSPLACTVAALLSLIVLALRGSTPNRSSSSALRTQTLCGEVVDLVRQRTGPYVAKQLCPGLAAYICFIATALTGALALMFEKRIGHSIVYWRVDSGFWEALLAWASLFMLHVQLWQLSTKEVMARSITFSVYFGTLLISSILLEAMTANGRKMCYLGQIASVLLFLAAVTIECEKGAPKYPEPDDLELILAAQSLLPPQDTQEQVAVARHETQLSYHPPIRMQVIE